MHVNLVCRAPTVLREHLAHCPPVSESRMDLRVRLLVLRQPVVRAVSPVPVETPSPRYRPIVQVPLRAVARVHYVRVLHSASRRAPLLVALGMVPVARHQPVRSVPNGLVLERLPWRLLSQLHIVRLVESD